MGIPREKEYHFPHSGNKTRNKREISKIHKEWHKARVIIADYALPIAILTATVGLCAVDAKMTKLQRAHAGCYIHIVPAGLCKLLPR